MIVNFKEGKTTYRLLILPESRREQQAREHESLKPDPEILTKKQKAQRGG